MSLRIQGERQLKTPKTARPTPSKVRSALFNIWQHKIIGSRWLDLCAGSGAMSAEALLRGATEVIAIEIAPVSCKIISDNLYKISTNSNYQIIKGDVTKVIAKLTGYFDLIYFDPPYASNIYGNVLNTIDRLFHSSTTIAVEHSSYTPLPEVSKKLTLTDRRVYGQTCLSFFELTPNND